MWADRPSSQPVRCCLCELKDIARASAALNTDPTGFHVSFAGQGWGGGGGGAALAAVFIGPRFAYVLLSNPSPHPYGPRGREISRLEGRLRFARVG